MALNFDTPVELPPEWSTKDEIEFATKLRGEHMGGAFHCIEKRRIRLKDGKYLWYCAVKGRNPEGNLTALIFGNSFSMNIIAAVAANPLFERVVNGFVNTEEFPIGNAFERYALGSLIKSIKPDVTFIVQRYFQKELYETPINEIKSNKQFQHWNDVLRIIQSYTSAIVLNTEQIVFPYDISQEYIRRKFHNLPVETQLKRPVSEQSIQNLHSLYFQAKSAVMEAWFKLLDCPKCAWFDYRDAFCDDKSCVTVDKATGLPTFRDTEHISIIGLRYLKPFIDAATETALSSKK